MSCHRLTELLIIITLALSTRLHDIEGTTSQCEKELCVSHGEIDCPKGCIFERHQNCCTVLKPKILNTPSKDHESPSFQRWIFSIAIIVIIGCGLTFSFIYLARKKTSLPSGRRFRRRQNREHTVLIENNNNNNNRFHDEHEYMKIECHESEQMFRQFPTSNTGSIISGDNIYLSPLATSVDGDRDGYLSSVVKYIGGDRDSSFSSVERHIHDGYFIPCIDEFISHDPNVCKMEETRKWFPLCLEKSGSLPEYQTGESHDHHTSFRRCYSTNDDLNDSSFSDVDATEIITEVRSSDLCRRDRYKHRRHIKKSPRLCNAETQTMTTTSSERGMKPSCSRCCTVIYAHSSVHNNGYDTPPPARPSTKNTEGQRYVKQKSPSPVHNNGYDTPPARASSPDTERRNSCPSTLHRNCDQIGIEDSRIIVRRGRQSMTLTLREVSVNLNELF